MSEPAIIATVIVCQRPSLGGLYSPTGGFGPHRSSVAIPPPIIVKWAHVIDRIDFPLHFTPRIGARPIWGWFSTFDVALTTVMAVCRWHSLGLGALYSPIGGVGPIRSRVSIPPPTVAKRAHVTDRIGFSLHFVPRFADRPIWGWLFVSDVALTAVVAVYGWPSLGGLYSPIGGFGPHDRGW